MVDPDGDGDVLVEQVDGVHGVLQRLRQVTQLLEDRGQQVVGAGLQEPGLVLGGPALHGVGGGPGVGQVAAATADVGPDEVGAQGELGEVQRPGGGRGALGGGGDAVQVGVEARQGLELAHGRLHGGTGRPVRWSQGPGVHVVPSLGGAGR